MAKLTDWINESGKYEFCRSYGIPAEGEFVVRQEDYYISLLGTLHDILKAYYEAEEGDQIEKAKQALLDIVKGLLIYSQKETADDFHGVRQVNNQLYVASLYYLCDYSAIASWTMKGINIEDYDDVSSQLLSFLVTGGGSVTDKEVRKAYYEVFKNVEGFVVNGEDALLEKEVEIYNKKYEERNFDSPTDFYMTSVLRCVLKKFQEDNIWKTLRGIDDTFDWTAYVRHSYRQHILSFLPSQQDAIDKGLLNYTGAFSLKMPTSAGKSYITELLIYYEVHSNPNARILYLAPLRALGRELRDRFKRIHNPLGFTYATKYGGSAASITEDCIEDAQLLVATPESFLSIESSSSEALDRFTLVICDEGQLLEDLSRGINYEMLLTRLRTRNNIRFLFISAIIPNIEEVNQWLKGTDDHIGDSTYRPSKLVLAEALIEDNSVNLYLQGDGEYCVPNFITREDAQGEYLRTYNEDKGRWKIAAIPVGCALALKSLKAGSVLLFTTGKTRGVGCTTLAKHMIEVLENNPFDSPANYITNPHELYFIKEYASYQLGCDHLFCRALNYGFAYHHGDVPQDLREKIERAYDKGLFRMIISNTTLAEGINLPIKTIVIAFAMDQSNPGNYLPNTRLKNIIGRVGRAGRERYGTVMVPVINRNGRLIKTIREALDPNDSKLEKLKGTLYTLVEYLVNQKKIEDEKDINKLLTVTTFADAIDEMIVRSAEGNVNEMDIDELVTESLAYTLSDDEKKKGLKSVFRARHNVLKGIFDDEHYQLAKKTGLNLRELDAVGQFITDEHVKLAAELWDMTDGAFVSFMIDCILVLPTVQEEISSTSTKKKLMNDPDRLKRIAILWMQGRQYHEIASEVSIDVDKVVLIVIFLQGMVHDKTVSVLSYMSEVKDLEVGTATYWPEYLRLGISKRLMYEIYKLRVPERIQLHAINDFYEEAETEYGDYDLLEFSLIENKNRICQFMRQKDYPTLSIKGLMEVIDYLEISNNT